jgi:uncharacterized protein (DUF427 family)
VPADLLDSSDAPASWCEFQGAASYLDALVDGRRFRAIGWRYPAPSRGYEALRDHVAFYPEHVGCAWLDDERVRAQPSGFYGCWTTSDITGPFKGPPGTQGW